MRSPPSLYSQPWEDDLHISERINQKREKKEIQTIGEPTQETADMSHKGTVVKRGPRMTSCAQITSVANLEGGRPEGSGKTSQRKP